MALAFRYFSSRNSAVKRCFQRRKTQLERLTVMNEDIKEPEVRMVQARRSPAQERSQETVQRIFAAAARLLARGVPFEDVTTGMIASEAGVSVGSLYRFFPDKQAIVDAIAVRHLGMFKEELLRDMMMSPPADGPSALVAAIDAFVAYLDQHADFRTIAYGGRHVSRNAREAQSASDADGAQLVKMLMGQVLGIAPGPDLDRRLRILTEVGDTLLALAYAPGAEAERAPIIDEMKRLLTSYLFSP